MKDLEAQNGSDEDILYEIVEKEVIVGGKKIVTKVKVYRSTTPMEPSFSVGIAEYGKVPVD